MANNKLEVDLIVNDDKGSSILDNFKRKMEDVRNTADFRQQIRVDLDNKTAQTFNLLENKTFTLKRSLDDISKISTARGFDVMSKSALDARDKVISVEKEISYVKKLMSETVDPKAIRVYTQEAKALESELSKVQNQISRFNENSLRPPAAPRGGIGGHGGAKPLPTLRGYGAVLQQFSPVGEMEINAASQLAGAAGITTASFAALGGLAALGFAAIKYSQSAREEAEKRLKVEESIAIAVNNQIISQREGLQNLQKAREEAQKDREFNRYLGSSSIEDLTNRKTTLEQLQKLIPATLPALENGKVISKPNESFQKNSQELLAIDAQIDALRQQKQKDQIESFRKNSENYKKSLDDAARAEKEHLQSVEKAKEKILDLQKTSFSFLDGLFAKAGKDNPFVSVYAEADKSMQNLRESTKGLSRELQDQFSLLQRQQNSLQLFQTRLNNNLNVFDLRADAKDFRNPTLTDTQLREQRDSIGRNYINFDQRNAGNALLRSKGFKTFDQADDQTKQDVFEYATLFNVTAAGYNAKDFVGYLANSRRKIDPNKAMLDRLESKIAIVNGAGAATAEERAAADRSIISLTSGLKADQLTDRIRNEAAAAREREAARLEQAEKTANEKRDRQIEIQNQINENLKKLIPEAEKGGLQGLIRIVDETNGKAEIKLGSRPAPSDVKEQFAQ